MDYKELIELSKKAAAEWEGTHEYYQAATLITSLCSAIETLLAEREAAMQYIPHQCDTCKWWQAVGSGMACCTAPEELGPCYLGRGKAYQWRGLTEGKDNA